MGKKLKSKASNSNSKATNCSSKTTEAQAVAVDNGTSSTLVSHKETACNKRRGGKLNVRSKVTNNAIVEDKELSNELLRSGYSIKYMVGDGNCLFRSIADQLRYTYR